MKRYRTINIDAPELTTYSDILTDTVNTATFNATMHLQQIDHDLIDEEYKPEPNQTKIIELNEQRHGWERLKETMNELLRRELEG